MLQLKSNYSLGKVFELIATFSCVRAIADYYINYKYKIEIVLNN